MNVGSATDLSEIKFYANQALEIRNVDIKDEEKAADEITFIPWEDMSHEKYIGKDGKQFEVVSYYKVKGEALDKDYLDVFSAAAQGEDVKCYDYYVDNFIAEVTKNFSDSDSLKKDDASLRKGVNNLVSEIKKNISDGISSNIEDLNTKFNVNGVDFTLKELMDSSKAMEYSSSILVTTGSGLDYENYAEMGIALGKVKAYAAKNLNADQQKLLNDTMSARVQKTIESVPKNIDDVFNIGIVKDETNKFYGIKYVQRATNEEYAKKIMDTFANADYSSMKSFEKATEEYKQLIKPVLESAGVINMGRNQALTDTTNYEINNFKSLFNESYKKVILSVAEFRKKFADSKNVIDLYS